MGKSSGGGDQTTTQKTEPWGPQQGYLKDIFSEAEGLYGSGNIAGNVWQGPRVAPFAPEQQAALQAQAGRAMQGSPLVGGAQDLAQRTIGGEFLDPEGNPALQNVLDYTMSRALPGVDTQFAGSGRYGSGNWANARAEAAQEAAARVYGDERTAQQRAMTQAPQLAQEDYRDIAALQDAGAQRQQQAQQQITAAMQQAMEEGNLPYEALQRYGNLIGGSYGSETTQTQPGMEQNPISGAVGGASTGAGLAGMLGASNPWTAAAAGVGGLLGLFG